MKSKVVLGLGFGDEGKGITTDFLCCQNPNSTKLVTRFSGGSQAGHTVMVNGVKHVFSSVGSGTLRDVSSYFTEDTAIYPISLLYELMVLKSKGFVPNIYYHPFCKIITPMDVIFNQSNANNKEHGTCGLGVGATMKREESMYSLRMIDLLHPKMFEEKYHMIFERYYKDYVFDLDSYLLQKDYFFNNIQYFDVNKIVGYEIFDAYDEVIFEGSQGIMLDMDHGIFPNVTYANTTTANITNFLVKSDDLPEIFYVTRCYQTRHGNGWMSNRGGISLINDEEEINVSNEYQGAFKIGEVDYDLLNYALQVDEVYHPFEFNKNLVITCLDQRPDFSFKPHHLNTSFKRVFGSYGPDSKDFKRLLYGS